MANARLLESSAVLHFQGKIPQNESARGGENQMGISQRGNSVSRSYLQQGSVEIGHRLVTTNLLGEFRNISDRTYRRPEKNKPFLGNRLA